MKICDYDLQKHEEAAKLMNISRSTFSRIYESARRKITKAFANVCTIEFNGGCARFYAVWLKCPDCEQHMYHNCIDFKKIYEFNIIKSKAGDKINTLSLTFNLTTTPNNINIASPPEEINKIGFIIKPTSKPIAPNISKIAISIPNFSNPNRLNSLFIFENTK